MERVRNSATTHKNDGNVTTAHLKISGNSLATFLKDLKLDLLEMIKNVNLKNGLNLPPLSHILQPNKTARLIKYEK